ncbi:Replication factor A 2 [Gossypium arboreum]|uniref:Replication factor A 2 n=1 Tax=Gossypium arboreum TaxID=29729 RepID=A0A0B0N423_GOSAR|nr:Replication factor A 2 [Gossypium arboreum]
METRPFPGADSCLLNPLRPSPIVPPPPPKTVKQLKDLSRGGEYGISIDGVDVNNIVLVGMVSKIDNPVSDCTFRVDDSTGWVECFSGQYSTVEEQICGVSSRVLQYLRRPAYL